MRIVFDMQACQTPGSRHRGIGRYSLAHVRAFITVATGHEVILILNNAFSDAIELVRRDFSDILDPGNILVFSAMSGLQDVTENNRWRHDASLALYQDFIRDLKPDVFHVCSLFEGYNDSVTGIVDNYGGINSVTLYDLIPYQYSESYLVDQTAQDWYARKLQSMKSADLVLAISASSREEGIDLVGLEPEQVVNISSAIGDHFCVSPSNTERRIDLQKKFGLHHDYIMYTGGADSRKNIEGLIAAYALLPHALRDGLQLAVVCNMDLSSRERLQALAKSSNLAAHELVLTGFVTEEELVDLYNMAKLFVFPSLHEGFGLPALEAMACGIPTLVSNTSSLPEVVGRADMQFDPRDPYAISQAIIQTLDSPERMADLREYGLKQAKSFSWEHTAVVTLQAFEHAVAEKRRQKSYFSHLPVLASGDRPNDGGPQPGLRPRLAFVSPLPPCESGIAHYIAELLPELSRYYEIDVITPQESISDRWIRGAFTRRTPNWLLNNAGLYDRVLYHFGDSALHAYMFELLEQVPGTVVLHDFYLSGVLQEQQNRKGKSNDYALALYRSHGYKAVQVANQDSAQSARLYPANLPVLTQAMGVIVHSEHSRHLANEFYGQEVGQDWACLPLLRAAKPLPDSVAAKVRLGMPADSRITATLGAIASSKFTLELIDAWAQTQASDPDAWLVLVGQNDEPDYREQVIARIVQGPANERIRITGYLSVQDYDLWLAAADVAVQLHKGSRGETLTALYDCLGAGKPLIYNASDSSGELPDTVAIRVSDAADLQKLSHELNALLSNPVRREQLSHAALTYRERLSPAKMALHYWQTIESFNLEHPLVRQRQLLDRLRRLPGHGQQPLASHVELACAVTQNIGYGQLPSCYIDISSLPKEWPATLQTALKNLLLEPPQGWRVELVEQFDDGYQLACNKVCDLLELPGFGDLPLLTGSQDAWIHITEVLVAPGIYAKLRHSECAQLQELERLTPQALTNWLQGQAFAGRNV